MNWLDPSSKKKVICLIGIDGTGKTTHAISIMNHLQNNGRKCRYVWFGSPYFFSFPFMIACRLLDFTKAIHLANHLTFSKHQYYKNRPVSLIWPWVQFLDVVIYVTLLVNLPLFFGSTVICDRFIPDTLVELMTDTRDFHLHRKLVGRLMLKKIPRCSRILLLDVNEETALRRKDDVPEVEYLVIRRIQYRLLIKDLLGFTIDAEEPFASVQENILNQINDL